MCGFTLISNIYNIERPHEYIKKEIGRRGPTTGGIHSRYTGCDVTHFEGYNRSPQNPIAASKPNSIDNGRSVLADSDSLEYLYEDLDSTIIVDVYSSVLALQGKHTVSQPIRYTHTTLGEWYLYYNGELYNYILDDGQTDKYIYNLPYDLNDTLYIGDYINKKAQTVSNCNDFATAVGHVLQTLLGPHSILIYIPRFDTVIVGKDSQGRKSLLIGDDLNGDIYISSCGLDDTVLESSITWRDFPYNGIYIIDLGKHFSMSNISPINGKNTDIRNSSDTYTGHLPSYLSLHYSYKDVNLLHVYKYISAISPFNIPLYLPLPIRHSWDIVGVVGHLLERSISIRLSGLVKLFSKSILSVGVLFSGGIDCALMVIAMIRICTYWIEQNMVEGVTIYLLTVNIGKNIGPDRITALYAFLNLKHIDAINIKLICIDGVSPPNGVDPYILCTSENASIMQSNIASAVYLSAAPAEEEYNMYHVPIKDVKAIEEDLKHIINNQPGIICETRYLGNIKTEGEPVSCTNQYCKYKRSPMCVHLMCRACCKALFTFLKDRTIIPYRLIPNRNQLTSEDINDHMIKLHSKYHTISRCAEHRQGASMVVDMILEYASLENFLCEMRYQNTVDPEKMPSVLFSGTAADEYFVGYSRYFMKMNNIKGPLFKGVNRGTAFPAYTATNCFSYIKDEIERIGKVIQYIEICFRDMDMSPYTEMNKQVETDRQTLGYRNYSRDDRAVSRTGKELRMPYADNLLVNIITKLPIPLLLDKRLLDCKEGDVGYVEKDNTKWILRELMDRYGYSSISNLKKRAIQFGSGISKMDSDSSFKKNKHKNNVI